MAVVSLVREHEVVAELVEAVLRDVGGGDRRALLDQPPHDRGAQAAAGPGDHDHSAVEPAHGRVRTRLELAGELYVEEAERELVVLHQVHELLGLGDLG